MRMIDTDTLKTSICNYANEQVRLNDRRWDVKCTAIIADMLGTVDKAPTVDAIPIDWLERRLDETAEETARGDDQVELNNAIFQVLVEWEKERRKNGEAGH